MQLSQYEFQVVDSVVGVKGRRQKDGHFTGVEVDRAMEEKSELHTKCIVLGCVGLDWVVGFNKKNG